MQLNRTQATRLKALDRESPGGSLLKKFRLLGLAKLTRCAPFQVSDPNIVIIGTGFMPSNLVRVYYNKRCNDKVLGVSVF